MKPCPLCGGHAEEKIVFVPNGFLIELKCYRCSFGRTKKPHIPLGQNYITPDDLNDQFRELETAWNNRTTKCPYECNGNS